MPHSAFEGQTPDEMYFGTGDNIQKQLREYSIAAREAHLKANRSQTCRRCEDPVAITSA